MHQHTESLTSEDGVLTVRASSGLSGDMMLSGLAALAGVTQEELDSFCDELGLPALKQCLVLEKKSVNGIAGFGATITLPHEHAHRTLGDIETLIRASAMPKDAAELAADAFAVLAEAEGAVHGKRAEEVHFHEVGALDSILDTCVTCRLFALLSPSRFVCSPLPLADGTITCAHGQLASPAPAVLAMLPGMAVRSFSGRGETVTPTAISLLRVFGAEFGPWPGMVVEKTAISYGSKVFADAPNGAIWALGKHLPSGDGSMGASEQRS